VKKHHSHTKVSKRHHAASAYRSRSPVGNTASHGLLSIHPALPTAATFADPYRQSLPPNSCAFGHVLIPKLLHGSSPPPPQPRPATAPEAAAVTVPSHTAPMPARAAAHPIGSKQHAVSTQLKQNQDVDSVKPAARPHTSPTRTKPKAHTASTPPRPGLLAAHPNNKATLSVEVHLVELVDIYAVNSTVTIFWFVCLV
jgi:hypothetical protein